MIKKITKAFVFIIAIISTITVLFSGWWLYKNPVVDLSKTDTGLKGVTEVYKGEKKGAEYGPSKPLESVEQIKKDRQNTSQPLYLNGWITIPDIGLERQIFEGTSDRVLTYGAGTINPNESPEKIGTYALAAHNYADWRYGTGFSSLQVAKSSVIGKEAYITDGNKLYTYKIVSYDEVDRDYSMPYTEDDWNNRDLSDFNKKYANPKKEVKGDVSINPQDTYSNSNKDDKKTFTYGRTLTLYTCLELPPDFLHSYSRIIVRGVQTKEEPIPMVNNSVLNNFDKSIDSQGNKVITGIKDDKKISLDKIEPQNLMNSLLAQNKYIINYIFNTSIVAVIVSFILLILIKRYW